MSYTICIRKIVLRSFIFLFLVSSAMAQTASVESVRELLAVTEVKKLLDGMFVQIDPLIKSSISQATAGRNLSKEQQLNLEKITPIITEELVQVMKEELSWERMEPMYLQIYQKSFTQEEVDGLLSFYKSPAGVALIKKMPLVMQESMVAMQQHMGPMMTRVQEAIEKAVKESEKKK